MTLREKQEDFAIEYWQHALQILQSDEFLGA